MNSEGEKGGEIVIIRRGGHGHEEGHHGGMWKIAYADFMTALMALFLVLWLVNATDEQTQAQIAAYFNPIDLSDTTTSERGLQDKKQAGTGDKGESKVNDSGSTEDKTNPRNDMDRSGAAADESLFTDPYDVLSQLAAQVKRQPLPGSGQGDEQAGTASAGGEAFRDPFDPDFRFNSNREESTLFDLSPKYDPPSERKNNIEAAAKKVEAENGKSALPFADRLAEEAAAAAREVELAAQNKDADPVAAETAEIKHELFQRVKHSGLVNLPDISVEKTEEGILISVTDQADFEMFSLSSAEPKPELVVLMEQLAEILTKQPGEVIVRGHTDARPFRSKSYDNWRLSTDRAHIARFMLLRGGLGAERVTRVEGYADRTLKDPDDPLAAKNRRIEILLKPEMI